MKDIERYINIYDRKIRSSTVFLIIGQLQFFILAASYISLIMSQEVGVSFVRYEILTIFFVVFEPLLFIGTDKLLNRIPCNIVHYMITNKRLVCKGSTKSYVISLDNIKWVKTQTEKKQKYIEIIPKNKTGTVYRIDKTDKINQVYHILFRYIDVRDGTKK